MTTAPQVKIQRLKPDADGDIPLPQYMTEGAAGMDIRAAVPQDTVLPPREVVLVPTGFALELPPGYEAQIRPRSGLAVKHGIGLINAPGTIDADYRGEVQVALINHGTAPFTIARGDRIAQMVISPVCQARLESVTHLADSQRGAGGFGHTGQ